MFPSGSTYLAGLIAQKKKKGCRLFYLVICFYKGEYTHTEGP